MTTGTRLDLVRPQKALAASQQLRGAGWLLLTLPNTIVDRKSFVEAIRLTIPTDPPLGPHLNWDGLTDSVFGGLREMRVNRVAIYWPDASRFESDHPDDFRAAVQALLDAANDVARDSLERPATIDVRIVVGSKSGSLIHNDG